MLGTVPQAMISGQLVGIGDKVSGFTVLKIEPLGVVLSREGVKLELLFE